MALTLRLSVLAILAMVLALPKNLAIAQEFSSEDHRFQVTTLAEGLEYPWGLAFLPNGDFLITERPGQLRLFRNGALQDGRIPGAPRAADNGQGGLLDVLPHPKFEENNWIYLSYSGGEGKSLGTKVARARLVDDRLVDLQTIVEVEPESSGGRHFGSRLAFGPDGMLYITTGDRGSPDRSQDLSDMAGSVLRVTEGGKVPPDNPFVGRDGVAPEIFSYGHRNPQGLTVHPESGRLWSVEHGPRGGDEANVLTAGANYGWPVITYGRSYAGFRIGEGFAKEGMVQPATYWVPSISPSGMAFYDGSDFPAWEGNLFVGALSGQVLVRLELEGDKVTGEERLLKDLDERIRDVRMGPDGKLYLLTDSPDGALLRLDPVN